jgi:hypothetical protein
MMMKETEKNRRESIIIIIIVTANSMRLNIAKTYVVSYIRKINFLSYQLCHAAITLTSNIEDLGNFFCSKLHFHSHANYVFSECIKFLVLIRSITYRFFSLECLHVLVRSEVEYASVVSNSITSTNVNKLERIQQKFASVFIVFSLMFNILLLLP